MNSYGAEWIEEFARKVSFESKNLLTSRFLISTAFFIFFKNISFPVFVTKKMDVKRKLESVNKTQTYSMDIKRKLGMIDRMLEKHVS